MTIQLLDENGEVDYARQGKSCELVGDFVGVDGTAITLASLTSLAMTLFDKEASKILNSRNAVNILNANGGTVSSGGVLTLKLSGTDNAIYSNTRGPYTREVHVVAIDWTYLDTNSVSQDGGEMFEFEVEVWPTLT